MLNHKVEIKNLADLHKNGKTESEYLDEMSHQGYKLITVICLDSNGYMADNFRYYFSRPLDVPSRKIILGEEVGDTCNREGCAGIITKDGSCQCATSNPPCSWCENDKRYCSVCDWRVGDPDETFIDHELKGG